MQLIIVEVRLRDDPAKKHRKQLKNLLMQLEPINGVIKITNHERRKKSLIGYFHKEIDSVKEMLILLSEIDSSLKKNIDSCWTVELKTAGAELK